MIRSLILAFVLALAPVSALAHKVIASVFPSGEAIEGEVGFSNGDMAVGQVIEVLGPDNEALGKAITDADGFFIFTPERAVAHRFHANLGAGHVADVVMSAEDVSAILGVSAAPDGAPSLEAAPLGSLAASGLAGLQRADEQAIARIVRDEMRPLRQEIAAYKERNNLQTILGGMGYILGLFGLGFYLAARRKLAA